MPDPPRIRFSITRDDVLAFHADVLALKFAQALYGADQAVVRQFEQAGIDVASSLPKKSAFLFVDSRQVVGAEQVLFVGVDPLYQFGYPQIRDFSRRVLSTLSGEAPRCQHLAVTIHGASYGLDEVEAFESEVAGFLDAINSGQYPSKLRQITVVEHNASRVRNLQATLLRLLPEGLLPVPGGLGQSTLGEKTAERLRAVGYDSSSKPHIFVAMPFSKDMDDVYHYGVQGAVNSAGFLCERADFSTFTGDAMAWVRDRITTAAIVIAELSGANPNVYLEVGYAWGCGRPTILLVRQPTDLKFDVRTQRYLVYDRIQDLEKSLRTELDNLGPTLRDQRRRSFT